MIDRFIARISNNCAIRRAGANMVAVMGNPGAQHELVCTLVQKHPSLYLRLAELTGAVFPAHDQIVPAPNSHQVRGGKPLETDGTVRLLQAGRPVWFAQAEVQRRYDLDKYATLHAYHGSEVRNSKTGGQMFVLSVKKGETGKFRDADDQYQPEFTYREAYLSGDDLRPLADPDRPYEERALAAAMIDFSQGIPENARHMLREMSEHDLTVANLYMKAILEEVKDVAMLEEALQPDMFERLRELSSFREYEAKVKAEGKAEAEAEAAEKAQAATAVAAERAVAEAVAATAAAIEKARADSKVEDLIRYLVLSGDPPSSDAIKQISACQDAAVLGFWLMRAYQGEKAADIFAEPQRDPRV
jgi:hypothetical protein